MKAVVATFNQEEKALVGAFSVIMKTDCETDGSTAALVLSTGTAAPRCGGGHNGGRPCKFAVCSHRIWQYVRPQFIVYRVFVLNVDEMSTTQFHGIVIHMSMSKLFAALDQHSTRAIL